MLYKTRNIEKAAKWLKEGDKEVAFVIDEHNRLTLFTFAYWQFRYKTLKSFKTIIYTKKRHTFFYLLKTVSILTFGYYRVIEQ
ncbi:MAG: hypothetical protein IE885_06635 [Campylobacterales bacterium]|nr:hypothetical protein [Campylobacterales bacterium]